jgi:segregation and condensation protein A
MEKLSFRFRLPVFEGPLDALLYLISKHKLNIYDIPIAELLDQYLDYLSQLTAMDLEVTSEFLEMASRLVQIKSAMLLPRYEDEKGTDPRSELMTTLIEYRTCKEMARLLAEKNRGFGSFVREPQQIGHDWTYRRRHRPGEIAGAFADVAGRMKRRLPPTPESFRGIVGRRVVSVAVRVVHVVRRLWREGTSSLRSLFDDSTGRSEAVATFLAVLELIKSRRIAVDEEDGEQMVRCIGRTRRRQGKKSGAPSDGV